MKKSLFLPLLFLLLFSPLVLAAPPFQGSSTVPGLQIEYTKIDYLQLGQDYQFNFHVYNVSDGQVLTNSTASCIVDLYNTTGYHILDNQGLTWAGNDFYINFSSSYFNTNGEYSVHVSCNTTSIGGFISFPVQVTPEGITQGSIFDNPTFLVLFIVSLIFFLLGAFMKMPSLGFIASILLLLNGMYVLIYGFNNVTNLYTQGTGVSLLGLAIILMIVAAYEWMTFGEREEE